jgi:hypothetical protein
MSKTRTIHDTLNRLAAAEEEFLRREFLAPLVRGGVVFVRLAGVVCRFRIRMSRFTGFGIFRPTRPGNARLVRPATLSERQAYLALFDRVRLILCRRVEDQWLALPANQGARGLPQGEMPVFLVEDAQPFEIIMARFDGAQCWFERLDPRHDPATAAYLRQALVDLLPAANLRRRGLTPEERRVYGLRLQVELEARRDRTEERLRAALAHAGADFQGYLERDDSYRVDFAVGGARHVSVVNKRDLTVQVAGICLSGRDAQFDLASLVGVLREAETEGGAVRVGADNAGMAEDHYWRVHPPQGR